MLELQTPTSGLLFGSFLYREDLFSKEELIVHWEKNFGPHFEFTPEFNPLAQYYSNEMGPTETLKRFFVISSALFPREILLEAKLKAQSWEIDWAQDSKRAVNLDIGLLTLENFTLATSKNYSHRIYLGQNIFSDLTYQFQHGEFQTLPWTYPDYADEKKIQFLTWARVYLLTLLTRGKNLGT